MPRPSPRGLIQTIISIGLVLLATAVASAECFAPIPAPVTLSPDGTVTIRWVHPDLNADTTRASNGSYNFPVHFGTSVPSPRLAFKVNQPPGDRLLRTVRVYVIALAGVTAADWSAKAELRLNLHADSNGQPGPLISDPRIWPIGEYNTLRTGGYFEDFPDVWLPDDLEGFWAVIEWPDQARGIVALGAHNGYPLIPIMAGFGEPTTWTSLPEPSPLVSITVLHPEPASSPTSAQSALPDGFAILKATTGGFDFGQFLLSFEDPSARLTLIDSQVYVGQSVAYRVGAVCGSDTAWSGPTAQVAVDDPWGLDFDPPTLESTAEAGEPAFFDVTISNSSQSRLTLALSEDPLTVQDDDTVFSKLPTGALSVYPPTCSLKPGEEQVIDILVDGPLSPGQFHSTLRIHAAEAEGETARNFAVPLILHSDQVTSVGGESPLSHAGRGGNWQVRIGPNPFSDKAVISITPESSQTATGSAGSSGQISVFDIQGRLRHHVVLDQTAIGSLASGDPAEVTISETDGWPSGIYFCRVRLGANERVIKLVLVR